jgi:hypothetical protein
MSRGPSVESRAISCLRVESAMMRYLGELGPRWH